MRLSKLSENVFYIGVNDRTTVKFESMWSLPYGISYNSYLVVGTNKSAIIDGVDESHALEQIDHIKAILGDKVPDYLIINHMEPDHSGAIRILKQNFPSLIVVGNNQTLSMIKGYYGICENILAVKDNDILDLGGDITLRFSFVPMLHWPETMVTYLESEKTLFSGDAFGCFGALNGAVKDTKMCTDRYWPEMIRYYSCIVGKYGTFVQKALTKLSSIDIKMICSTHGPVWTDSISKVLTLYDKMSRYDALDDGVTIVYGSMYGNTQRIAESIADGLASAGVLDIDVYNVSKDDHSRIIQSIFTHRGLVLTAPTYSDTLFPPMMQIMEAIKTRNIVNRDCLVIGSHTWSPKATNIMSRYIEDLGMVPVTLPLTLKQAPTSEFIAQCRSAAFELADKLKKGFAI